jgi:hypothetical protein
METHHTHTARSYSAHHITSPGGTLTRTDYFESNATVENQMRDRDRDRDRDRNRDRDRDRDRVKDRDRDRDREAERQREAERR